MLMLWICWMEIKKVNKILFKNMENYTNPEFNLDGFNCPHCGAFAHQSWSDVYDDRNDYIKNLQIAYCKKCENYSLWHSKKIIFPESSGISLPNMDLNKDIREDYNEARCILNKSPRGACALLRLALQKLCKQLGEKGKNINNDVASLVKKGLPSQIQQSLDIVRVIGNESVHPGELDLKDDVETATKLFSLINIIAEIMITQPNKIEETYKKLPPNKLEEIKNRDS